MAAKFEISKDHAGKFRFHLKAPNGEIIAASPGYETKANAEKGIEAIKTHAPGAPKTTAKPNPPSALPVHRRAVRGLKLVGCLRGFWGGALGADRAIRPNGAMVGIGPDTARHSAPHGLPRQCHWADRRLAAGA